MIDKAIKALVRLQGFIEGNRRYRLLYEEMLAGFAIHRMLFDKNGKPVDYIFLDVNPAFERLTGINRKKIIGRRVRSVLPETEEIWIERYGNVVRTGTSDSFEAYSQSIGRHYMVVAFSMGESDFAVTFYETSTIHHLQSELMRAYDETLSGWARALDLRDHETEGHSQRVAIRCVWLAELFGIVDEHEITRIRRGALLHDIGKIGVADSILLKAGPLTADERRIIEQHPIIAKQFIEPISYLQPSLDIPWCHHEKWDGTGYPRGLKGEEIPLPARLFTVVDIWDALTNDRPYRGAMPKNAAIDVMLGYSGGHFQPEVLSKFLAHLDTLP